MRTAILTLVLALVGVAAAAVLVGAAGHARNWGELTTPALLAAGLLAWALGSVAFAPRRRA